MFEDLKLEQRGGRDEVRDHSGPYRSWEDFGFYAKRAEKSLKGFEQKSNTAAAV